MAWHGSTLAIRKLMQTREKYGLLARQAAGARVDERMGEMDGDGEWAEKITRS